MKIAFLGDVSFTGKYDLATNPNAQKGFEEISKFLSSYDYVIANLENPLTTKEKTLVCKSMHIKSHPINVELLKYLNINVVNISNNHINDFGRKGIKDTIEVLENNNIKWYGLNDKSITLEFENEMVELLSFCCYSANATNYTRKGVTPITFKNIKRVISEQDKNKLQILNFHWGEEHTNYPRISDIKFVKDICKKFKDLIIIGHHTHTIQPIIKENNSLICYSLGNFCFDELKPLYGNQILKQNEDNKKGIILELNIENGQVKEYNQFHIMERDDKIVLTNLEDEMKLLNENYRKLDTIKYNELRNEQIRKNREFKFGKKDLNWVLSKINYYAIGSYILRKKNEVMYKRYIINSK